MRRSSLSLAVAATAAVVAAGFYQAVDTAQSQSAVARPAAAQTAAPVPVLPAAEPGAKAVPADRASVQMSFAPVVKRAAPAVVNVYATGKVTEQSPFQGDPFFERFFGRGSPFGQPRQRAQSSLGSGVMVDAAGVVVTNNHVVADASEVKVALADGREYQADIVLRDERSDLAVLKLKDASGPYPVLDFADSDAIEVGDLVLAIGNPFGVGQTVTSGIVSAIARTEEGINDSSFFIQTDAAINPGNSGGALVDMNGAMVGLNTAIFSRTGGSVGIGFAIPSNMVRTVVMQALAGSKSVERPWIGIQGQQVTPDLAATLGLKTPSGALVTRVDADSPAARAGLKVGDLIAAVGGQEVRSLPALDYRLAVAGIGKPAPLTIMRDGRTLTATVTPVKEPDVEDGKLTMLDGQSPLTGATVAELSSAVADKFHIRDAAKGLAIVQVDADSPAEQVGFQPGDVIQALQGKPIETVRDIQDLIQKRSRIWRITLDRGGNVTNLMIGG